MVDVMTIHVLTVSLRGWLLYLRALNAGRQIWHKNNRMIMNYNDMIGPQQKNEVHSKRT
jgi:hypothetical protein